MLKEFVKTVLVVVIGFTLRFVFDALGVPVDEGTYNALVGAIVAYLLSLFGFEGAKKLIPTLR